MPYVVVLESFEDGDVQWRRRALHPELPGVSAEADTPLEALDRLDVAREAFITERLQSGQAVPVPRPSLVTAAAGLNLDHLSFARWLVRQQHISDGLAPAD